MPDIALQVIINEYTGFLGFDKQSRMYKNGDIIQGMLATDIATDIAGTYTPNEPITSPRSGFIFVTGVPTSVALKIRAKLMEPEEDVSGIITVRRWGFNPADVPANKRNQLINNKYTQVTWDNLKAFIKHKREARLLTDADFN